MNIDPDGCCSDPLLSSTQTSHKHRQIEFSEYFNDDDFDDSEKISENPQATSTSTTKGVRFAGSGPNEQREASTRSSERASWMADKSEVAPIDAHGHSGLALYEDEYVHKPKVAHIIRTLSIYTPLQPGTSLVEKAGQGKAAMGTFIGVFLPCIQNIFGVLFFIRLAWIVGTAGVLQSFFVVLICCMVTFTTSISLSAIATNGMVPAGGPYYMISRNLGPELGGAVGILFYLGTTVAASMYITGAAEIFLMYIVPDAKIFDDMSNCYRLYGTCVLIGVAFIVMAGVSVVNKFALPTVFIVNLCIILSFIGMFYNFNGSEGLQYCTVGDRLPDLFTWVENHKGDYVECNAIDLRRVFCTNESLNHTCDPYFLEMSTAGRIEYRQAIKGLSSGVVTDNAKPKYMEEKYFLKQNLTTEPVLKNEGTDQTDRYVYADITSSFIILVGVFFPSVTGIMAGSNRSGDLKDASRSIPLGTIAATTISSFVYLTGAVLIGASVDEMFLRDKFGQSAFGKLVVAELAVPHSMVIRVGSLIATIGAGMQSLTGAPRLLQAIARDGVIPLLAPFQQTTKRGEPLRAILVTVLICEMGILIAALESVTALISQFFLMCYLGVNSACALQSLLKAPSWRPRFRYYHWSLSMFGSCLCIAVMFMSHWIFAIVAFVIGVAVYKYIEYRGAEKEWGDGLRGLGLSAARYALLNLDEGPAHTKNWRPQILILCNPTEDLTSLKHDKLLAFASQMKAGKGLTVVASVIEGNYQDMSGEVTILRKTLKDVRDRYKIKGFTETLVCPNISQGLSALIQTSGLGGLKHNTVLFGWPQSWKDTDDTTTSQLFVDALRCTTAAKCASIVVRNVDSFPDTNERMTGKIDVWWVVHDGGMLMLLPFLLRQHKSWRSTRLRVFTVSHASDNSAKMKEDLEKFLYHLRIEAEVDVYEMTDSEDISEYAYERTLKMAQRSISRQDRSATNLQAYGADAQAHETDTPLPPSYADVQPHSDTEGHEADQPYGGDALAYGVNAQAPFVDADETERFSLPKSKSLPLQVPQIITDDNHKDVQLLGVGTSGCVNARRLPPPPSPRLDANRMPNGGPPLPVGGIAPPSFIGLSTYNVRRMHTAAKLNEAMKSRSIDAQLLFVNLPGPPKTGSEEYYMEFIEVLTEGLDRVVLVKGTGSEVVTIYS